MDGDPDGNGNVAARASHSSTTAVYNFWKGMTPRSSCSHRHKISVMLTAISKNEMDHQCVQEVISVVYDYEGTRYTAR